MKATSKRGVRWAIIGIVAIAVIAAAGAGFWVWHEQPRFCADLCHIMQPYEDTWASSPYEVHVHAEAGVECLDCHEPTIEEQVQEVIAYVTGDYEQPLREARLEQETCLSCKDHDSYPELAEATSDWERNPHASHWGDMECNLCHKKHRDQHHVLHPVPHRDAGAPKAGNHSQRNRNEAVPWEWESQNRG